MSEIIKKQIKCVIQNIIREDNSLIVLKGIPLNTVDLERPNLAIAIDEIGRAHV